MDRGYFDALTRLFAIRGSRRAALAAMLGGVLFGQAGDPAEAGRKHEGKHRKRRNRHDDDDGDNGQVKQCYPGTVCRPGQGRTNSGCDFSGSTVFAGRNVRGAILSGANFTGADASGADFRGAVLADACLVNADLRDARIDESTVLDGAIFCHTVLPDGSIDDTGCNRATTCCPTAPPPGGQACRENADCPNASERCCDGRCTDVRFDANHCGSCQRTCDPVATHVCIDGTCHECYVCTDPRQCTFITIQDAVNTGDPVITVCPGTYKEHVSIRTGVTLVGLSRTPDEVVLDGEGRRSAAAVLTVEAGTRVTVQNLTVRGGKASDELGGGVVNFGELTLRDVHVTENDADRFNGGGIANRGEHARLTLENTQVTRNTAAEGGGVSNDLGQTTLRGGTRIEVNSATTGGGILNRGTLTLERAFVSGNTADESGGGILNTGGAVTLTQQSFVIGNTAGRFGGGGIDNAGGSVTFIGESFVTDNTANGGGSGGGILNRGTVTSDNRPIATLVVNNSPDDCVNAGSGTGCPA